MPEHAFLGTWGNDWVCDRGFKRVEEQCQEVQVPEHAFLDGWGNDWVCDRGFEREGNRCSPQ